MTGTGKPISAFRLRILGVGAPAATTASQSGFPAFSFVGCGMKFLSAAALKLSTPVTLMPRRPASSANSLAVVLS
jgi:hypothetical protein